MIDKTGSEKIDVIKHETKIEMNREKRGKNITLNQKQVIKWTEY